MNAALISIVNELSERNLMSKNPLQVAEMAILRAKKAIDTRVNGDMAHSLTECTALLRDMHNIAAV